jgi:hypothetical protein
MTTASRVTELGGVAPLPDTVSPHASKAVQKASDKFASSLGAVAEAGAEVTVLRQHVAEAPAEDRRVAAAAMEAGKPIPESIEASGRAQLAAAERKLAAAESLARTAQNEYLGAVVEDHAALIASLNDAMDAEAAIIASLVEQVEAASLRRATAEHALVELGDDPGHLTGRNVLLNFSEARGLPPGVSTSIETLRAG